MKAFVNRHKKRFSKFAVVGLSGVLVNEGLLFLLTYFAGLWYLISAVIAIEVSILTNFALNEVWTFKDLSNRHKGVLGRAGKYNLVAFGGMVINLIVLFALTELGLNYLISNLIGIGAATLWNYFVNLTWTWQGKRHL